MSTDNLRIEEKREIVYSSVLRYSAEATPLRERVLDRVVLAALVGSAESAPYRVVTIQSNLNQGSAPLRLRQQVIQDTLVRLCSLQLAVEHPSRRGRPAFHITRKGDDFLAGGADEVERLIAEAAQRHFAGAELVVRPELSLRVFRRFLFEVFAQYGRLIAQSVSGWISASAMTQALDTRRAIASASAEIALSPEQTATLTTRCRAFLASNDALDERLRFVMAQGYYFTQLLELDDTAFNPLAEHAFSGAVFYLDTNVLIRGLIPADFEEELFVEVVRIASRTGMELRVTRATLSETRDAIYRRIPDMERVVSALPEELLDRTTDQVLRGYLRAKAGDRLLTPQSFVERLWPIEDKLRDEWNITIDERTEAELVAGIDVPALKAIFRDEARARGQDKSEAVVLHDVAHYALITSEREKHGKTWFLTRDHSLSAVAARLHPAAPPFCFHHMALLQSISPFVAAPDDQFAFVDVFASLMADQFRGSDTVFRLEELAILAEHHADVMSTPVDQLLMALEHVKSRTLRGQAYTRRDVPEVSLSLRTFLVKDRESQIKALEEERARIARELEEERLALARTQAEASAQLIERDEELQETNQKVTHLSGSLAHLSDELAARSEELVSVTRTLGEAREAGVIAEQRALRQKRRQRVLVGVVVGVAVALWPGRALAVASALVPSADLNQSMALQSAKWIGTALFGLAALMGILHERMDVTSKVTLATLALAAAVFLSGVPTGPIERFGGVAGGISAVLVVVGIGIASRNDR